MSPTPGIPDRHRKPHPAEEVIPAAPPVPKSARKTMIPDAVKSPTVVAILTIIGALGGQAGLTKIMHGDPASSAETQQLRDELVAARKELSDSKVSQMSGKLDSLAASFDAWKEKQNQTSAENGIRDKRDLVMAEAIARLNGGPPNRSWPEPDDRDWVSSANPPPTYKTDLQWPQMPSEK